MVLYLAYSGGELCPGVLDRGVGADLGVSAWLGIDGRTFLGGRCGGSAGVHAQRRLTIRGFPRLAADIAMGGCVTNV